jgi:hypothetical protein
LRRYLYEGGEEWEINEEEEEEEEQKQEKYVHKRTSFLASVCPRSLSLLIALIFVKVMFEVLLGITKSRRSFSFFVFLLCVASSSL